MNAVAGSGPGPVLLSAAGSYPGFIVFRDAVSMKLIMTATPTTAGTKIIVEYDSATPTAALQMLDVRQHALPISFAGGLFGVMLFRLRRSKVRNLRALYLLSALAFVLTTASVLAGCGTSPVYTPCNITATPVTASAAAPPQSVVILTSKSSN